MDNDPLKEAARRARKERQELEKHDGPSFLERHDVKNVQHSKEEVRWGTPTDIVERARRVMGSIDLDPCSSIAFNDVVQAANYYSLDDRGENGLELPWFGNVFLNPPGGLVREFWRKALQQLGSGHVKRVFWVGFSLEQLALLASESYHPLDFSFCVLRKRIKFTRHDGYSGSPSHSNYVCMMGPNHVEFVNQFKELGRVYLK